MPAPDMSFHAIDGCRACAMSRSAAVAALESIDGVGRGGGANVRLQPLPTDNIDRAVEQAGNVIFQAGVVKNGDVGRRIEFHHDIDVAVGSVVAARAGTE